VITESVTERWRNERLAWRLSQLAEATGLSLPFLRVQARIGKLRTRKIGSAVIVLDEDARAFLAGESNEPDGDEAEAA
jgi:hypothetical protein